MYRRYKDNLNLYEVYFW